MDPALALIVVAVVLIVVGMLLGRRRNELAAEQGVKPTGRRAARQMAAEAAPIDLQHHPRPKLVEMHVVGDQAQVTFDVPIPDDGDEVLADLLVQEALEVVREKRHTLPMSQVTKVVAIAGRGDAKGPVGSHQLDTPGTLPPKIEMPSMLNLAPFANDPLEHLESGEAFGVPEVAVRAKPDELGPIGGELRIPKAVDMGLRAQGIDPTEMNAIEMVTGLLRLFGYRVTPAREFGQFLAEKAGERTFILGDPYRPGDHPEVDGATVDRFMADFSMSGCDRGLLVSEKYGPFEIYDKERRQPRVRFVTRERLQKMVDALALS